jgi:hypothetical protein
LSHTCSASPSQPGTGQPRAARKHPAQRGYRLVHGLDDRHPDGHPGRTQPFDINPPVLLLVGEDDAGLQVRDGGKIGVLGPRTRRTSRSAGRANHIVAPASAFGRVTATDSVSDGTSETTRRAGCSSRAHVPEIIV